MDRDHTDQPEPVKLVDKPFWRSSKAMVYLITLASTLVTAYTGVDTEVVRTLAEGCLFALPLLVGAQGAMDWAALRRGPR